MKIIRATVTVFAALVMGNAVNAAETIDVAFDTNLDNSFTGIVTKATGPFNSGDFVAGTVWTSEDGVKHLCLKGILPNGQKSGPFNQDSCFATGMLTAGTYSKGVTLTVWEKYLDGFVEAD